MFAVKHHQAKLEHVERREKTRANESLERNKNIYIVSAMTKNQFQQ